MVRMVSSGAVILCLDARIFAEYDEVLARPRFGFDRDAVAALLDYIDFRSEAVASEPLEDRLPDPDDEPFLEVAATCGADCRFQRSLRTDATVLVQLCLPSGCCRGYLLAYCERCLCS
jgi:predicted nucleic acid-binding protein